MSELKRVYESKDVPMGTFSVESGVIRVSDPCYCPTPRPGHGGALKHGEGILLLPALNGRWHLVGHMSTGQRGLGRWCLILKAFHESQYGILQKGERVGRGLFVDSGQMSVFDDAKFPREPAQFDYGADGSFYKQVCDLTWAGDEPKHGGCLSHGGVTSSGYGDGSYPAYVYTDSTGLALSVTVMFDEEEDEEDEDDDDDYDDDEEADDYEDDDDDEDEPEEDDRLS